MVSAGEQVIDGLVVEGLTVDADTVRLLDQVDLRAPAGAVTCLIGPSGSGKTTLLRAVAGLVPCAAERVTFDGADLSTVPVHERGIGMVTQDAALFPHLDVERNVAFGLRLRGWAPRERAQRAGEMLEMVGLAGFQHRSIHRLSGGERQRVALARALATQPRLLLLDEPFGALDRLLREHLVEEVHELVHALGVCALHVTHDQQEAATMATSLAVLREGHTMQQAAPSEVYAAPADAWTARFLGHRNVLEHAQVPAALLAVTPDAGTDSALLIPEAAVQIIDDLQVVAAGSEVRSSVAEVRGTIREVRRAPAREGVLLDVEGAPIWATLPPAATVVPTAGAVAQLAVEAGSMRWLPTA